MPWLPLLLFAATILGCESKSPKMTEPEQTHAAKRTDIEGLERLIRIPYPAEEVVWSTSVTRGRRDWSLRALLRLRPDDLQALLRRAGGEPTSQALMTAEQLSWMPEAVRAENQHPHTDPTAIRVDGVQIGPELFAAPDKSPLIHGRAVVFARHNLVYIGLFTM